MIHEQPIERLLTQDDILRAKCQKALANHRRRAKADGATLDYDAEDLIRLANSRQVCEYCFVPLGWDWQIDHRTPLARGSRGHALCNLAIVCGDCNCAKGQLSEPEYLDLLLYLRTIDPRGAADVRHRLKAGGAVHVREKKR